MIESIETVGIGPGASFLLEPGARLSLITGDNGLGKSFLLDVAWWACARDWPKQPVIPRRHFDHNSHAQHLDDPRISARLESSSGTSERTYRFDVDRSAWRTNEAGRPANPGLVLYARLDGGFSAWDPARNYYRYREASNIDEPQRPSAFHLTREEVWSGKKDDAGKTVSRGLLVDWREWQIADPTTFKIFETVFSRLLPPEERVSFADEPIRMPDDTAALLPGLNTPYGVIPITFASAGIQRILALTYLIVWMWVEHAAAARARNLNQERRIVLLLDEVEAHLHPRWQRLILPAVLTVQAALASDVRIQTLVATHSPLVMASVEPLFDTAQDKLFHLQLEERGAVLREMEWHSRGDAVAWLTSEVFGLGEATSIEAQKAIENARQMIQSVRSQLGTTPAAAISEQERNLSKVVASSDPFWSEWQRFRKLAAKREA
jgi:hypothetical protein